MKQSPEARSRDFLEAEGWCVDKASQWVWHGSGPPLDRNPKVIDLVDALSALGKAAVAAGVSGIILQQARMALAAVRPARRDGKATMPGHSKDLFGFIDLVAMRPTDDGGAEIRAIQATSVENLASRIDKALGNPAFRLWLHCDIPVEFHGWRRPAGKRFTYWRLERRVYVWTPELGSGGYIQTMVNQHGDLIHAA